jgi:hypothetical protein
MNKISKIFFFRTSRQISIKHGTKHPFCQVCSNKGPGLLQSGEMQK